MEERRADGNSRGSESLATVAETDDKAIEMRLDDNMGVSMVPMKTRVDNRDRAAVIEDAGVLSDDEMGVLVAVDTVVLVVDSREGPLEVAVVGLGVV